MPTECCWTPLSVKCTRPGPADAGREKAVTAYTSLWKEIKEKIC